MENGVRGEVADRPSQCCLIEDVERKHLDPRPE
jgi:hypothetical protein